MSFRARKPAKKLVIKDLRLIPSLPADYVEQTWAKVTTAVQVILSSDENAVTESKEALYRAVTDLCAQKKDAFMYRCLVGIYEGHLERIAEDLRNQSGALRSDGHTETSFLEAVETAWHAHCSKLRMIKNIFLHLDRAFIMQVGKDRQLFQSTGLPMKFKSIRSIWGVGMELFRSKVFPFASEETIESPEVRESLGSSTVGEKNRTQERENVSDGEQGSEESKETNIEREAQGIPERRTEAEIERESEKAGLVYARVNEGLLHLIEEERNGRSIPRALVRSLLRMLWSLGLYAGPLSPGCQNSSEMVEMEDLKEKPLDDFESLFLLESDAFYEREGEEKSMSLAISDYLSYVTFKLTEEENRLSVYLEARTGKRLLGIVKKHLITDHISFLVSVEKGAGSLLAEARLPELRTLSALLTDVGLLKHLYGALHAYTKSAGLSIVKRPEEEDEGMMQKVLDLKEKMDNVVSEALGGGSEFLRAVRAAYKHFLNVRGAVTAELLAKHMDRKLRSGNKALSEGELEHVMDQVIELFRFVENKDVFQAFFRTCLSKRLLLSKSASMDMEKTMLSKLKQECGANFTKKLEAMFTDMNVSRDLMVAYKDSLTVESIFHSIDLTTLVLTMGVWPTMPPATLTLPQELLVLQESFEVFYKQKYHNRVLTWQHAMGYCTVKAKFPQGEKVLCLSQYQATVVLQFNTAVKLSYSDLKSQTGMDDNSLKSTLQSLASGKVRVLLKAPKGRDVNVTDVFAFNVRFTAKLYRIKVNQIQLKETKEERDKTEKHILVERNMQVDAAIVRIMKTRKNLSHQMLLAEVFKQLRFPVQPRMVKQQIESLIEREYLERDDADDKVYRYLA